MSKLTPLQQRPATAVRKPGQLIIPNKPNNLDQQP